MEVQKSFKAGVVQFDIINGQIETNMDRVFAALGDLAGGGEYGLSEFGRTAHDYWMKAAQEGWASPDPVVFSGTFM
ncbi:MAG: hypothetical protein KKC20_04995, partial [Proteobacteria bacterium]|nr:hypothetical protein [Pseudomonadota bacterium]